MNERIQQLALQAGLKMCGCGCEMPTRQSAKFAELIVQECCSQVREIDAMEIRKHFGVEE